MEEAFYKVLKELLDHPKTTEKTFGGSPDMVFLLRRIIPQYISMRHSI